MAAKRYVYVNPTAGSTINSSGNSILDLLPGETAAQGLARLLSDPTTPLRQVVTDVTDTLLRYSYDSTTRTLALYIGSSLSEQVKIVRQSGATMQLDNSRTSGVFYNTIALAEQGDFTQTISFGQRTSSGTSGVSKEVIVLSLKNSARTRTVSFTPIDTTGANIWGAGLMGPTAPGDGSGNQTGPATGTVKIFEVYVSRISGTNLLSVYAEGVGTLRSNLEPTGSTGAYPDSLKTMTRDPAGYANASLFTGTRHYGTLYQNVPNATYRLSIIDEDNKSVSYNITTTNTAPVLALLAPAGVGSGSGSGGGGGSGSGSSSGSASGSSGGSGSSSGSGSGSSSGSGMTSGSAVAGYPGDSLDYAKTSYTGTLVDLLAATRPEFLHIAAVNVQSDGRWQAINTCTNPTYFSGGAYIQVNWSWDEDWGNAWDARWYPPGVPVMFRLFHPDHATTQYLESRRYNPVTNGMHVVEMT